MGYIISIGPIGNMGYIISIGNMGYIISIGKMGYIYIYTLGIWDIVI